MQDIMTDMNRRILVIDDSKSIHKDFEKILIGDQKTIDLDLAEAELFGETDSTNPQSHYELASAYQGQQGLEMVTKAVNQQRPYAMAFVDMRMPPGWDGVETISRVWEVDPDLLIVICTAYSDYSWSDIKDRLGKSERLLILKKPFDSIELCQMAASLVEKRHLVQQAQLQMCELEQMVEDRTAELQKEIAERQKYEQELLATKDVLQYQATHDPMTGLWNRAAICDALERELARSKREQLPIGLAFADIDHFKNINDQYGHRAGDTILHEVAERLKESVRPYDEIGRYGGEEFLMLLPGCQLNEAVEVMERTRNHIAEQPFAIQTTEIPVTISIGVTTIEPDETTELKDIVHRADNALYQAKRAGRNRVEHCTLSGHEITN